MWAIIVKFQKWCWISGIFKEHKEAQEYFALSKDNHEEFNVAMREIPAQDYPIMFIENYGNDFIYVTPEELAEKLLAFEKIEDEDHAYCNYYIFRKDYRAPIPGEDYLGATEHYHVSNHTIKGLISSALSVESVGGYGGIYVCRNCRKLSAGILSATGYGPPPGWQIIPWAESRDGEFDSYLRKEGETVPETHSAAYLTFCSDECRRLFLIPDDDVDDYT